MVIGKEAEGEGYQSKKDRQRETGRQAGRQAGCMQAEKYTDRQKQPLKLMTPTVLKVLQFGSVRASAKNTEMNPAMGWRNCWTGQ